MKKKVFLITIMLMAAVTAFALAGCGSDSASEDLGNADSAGADTYTEEVAETEAPAALTASEVNDLYARKIQSDLDDPNYYFQYCFTQGHVLAYDKDDDGIFEFVELGVGENLPQCMLVYKYVNGNVIRIPADPDDIISWTEPGLSYMSMYFSEAADRFCFFSRDYHGDSRLFSDYRIDESGSFTADYKGTQHFGTGAEGTGSKTYTIDADAVAADEQARSSMLGVAWSSGNTYPDNFHIRLCTSIEEMKSCLQSEGIPVY